MRCALRPPTSITCPQCSYLTGAAVLCVQDELWISNEQGDIRQGDDSRLQSPKLMDIDDQPSNGAAVDPPSETKDQQKVPPMASDGPLTIPALQNRIVCMLAAAGGGPIASGLDAVVARDSITHELISNLISAVEKVFAQHGEKAPRAHLSLFPSAVRAQDPSLKL